MKLTEKEIWKDIKGFEGLYQINVHGDIKSLSKRDGFYLRPETILAKNIKRNVARVKDIPLKIQLGSYAST